MRGISLWQPWASAMACGAKRIETRHWSTNIRGTVAIHAAKRRNIGELIHYGCSWSWIGALAPIGAQFGNDWSMPEDLPFGAIVAVGELVDCRPTETFTIGELDRKQYREDDTSHLYGWTERMMGNYDIGRFGWVFENVLRLKVPVPFKAKQGFFNVPDELLQDSAYAISNLDLKFAPSAEHQVAG